MAGDIEFGVCSICKESGPVNRKYYYYPIKCNCCNGKDDHHFEIVRHCNTCLPVPPKTIQVSMNPVPDNYDPHEVSKVQCDLCGHEWVAVRPEGLTELQCPNCNNTTTFENLTNGQP